MRCRRPYSGILLLFRDRKIRAAEAVMQVIANTFLHVLAKDKQQTLGKLLLFWKLEAHSLVAPEKLALNEFPIEILSIFSVESIAPSTVFRTADNTLRTSVSWFLVAYFNEKIVILIPLPQKTRCFGSGLDFTCCLDGSKRNLKSPSVFGQSFVPHYTISHELPISGISQHKFLKGSEISFGKQTSQRHIKSVKWK